MKNPSKLTFLPNLLKMKHLILEFAETPLLDSSLSENIVYDQELNLSVLKGTKIPAITYCNLVTETFTKSDGDITDSDKDIIRRPSDSYTTNKGNISDSSLDLYQGISDLLVTETSTYNSTEPSDSDKDHYHLGQLMATQTLTETLEATDSDKDVR
jgi:hypothetical protein